MRNGGCGLSRERGFRRGEALQAARGAETETLAHQEPEVEGRRVDEHSFSNVLLAPNVEAAHAAGLKQVRERPLHLLPAPALQPLAPVAPDSPPVAIRRLLCVPLPLPLPAAALGLAHIAPQLPLLHARHGLVRVVALVGHHLARLRPHLRQLPLRLVQRDRQRRRVSSVHRLHRQPDDGSGFHIDRVLELVRQVCPAVLHLRDPRLRVMRMHVRVDEEL